MTQQDENNILTTISLIFFSVVYACSTTNNEATAIELLDNIFETLLYKEASHAYGKNTLAHYDALIAKINLCCNSLGPSKLLITAYCKQLLNLAEQHEINSVAKLFPEKPENTKQGFELTKKEFDKELEEEYDKKRTEESLPADDNTDILALIYNAESQAIDQHVSSAAETMKKASEVLVAQTKFTRIHYFSSFVLIVQSSLKRVISATTNSKTNNANNLLTAVIHFLNLCGFIEPNTIANFLELNEEQKTILQPIMQQQKDISQHWLILPPNNSEPHPEVETPNGVKPLKQGRSYKQTLKIITEEEEAANEGAGTEHPDKAASIRNYAPAMPQQPSGRRRQRNQVVNYNERPPELDQLLKNPQENKKAEPTDPAPNMKM